MDKFYYNPISINDETAKFFPNVETLYLYKNNDIPMEKFRIMYHKYVCKSIRSDILELSRGVKKVEFDGCEVVIPKERFASKCEILEKDWPKLPIYSPVSIPEGFFDSNLEVVELPSYISKIPGEAFCGYCRLRRIVVHPTIEVGRECFLYCPDLEEVVMRLPDGSTISEEVHPDPNEDDQTDDVVVAIDMLKSRIVSLSDMVKLAELRNENALNRFVVTMERKQKNAKLDDESGSDGSPK